MEQKNMIIAAIVVIIVVIAAGAYLAFGGNEGGNGNDGDGGGSGDTYYFYLDGMGDLNGWYDAEGTDAEVALKAALDEAEISYAISGGWISSISNLIAGENDMYFGTYVFTANTTANAYPTYFGTGPVLNEIAGNIVYIPYTTYTFDQETNVMNYTLNPYVTESGFMQSGPFVSENYAPLDYDSTYWFYLDGMGDLNGWYDAEGTDAEDALKAALDEAGISYTIENGWASQIGDYVSGTDGLYFGTYVYTSNTTANPSESYFVTGTVLDESLGNIMYITLSTYTYDAETGLMPYDLNPMSTDADIMTTGPFATA